jgi:SAM-dependent methyltransferase
MPAYPKTLYETLGREPVHPFPARMAPGIVLEAMADEPEPISVLDPMMGSGTVLALARSKGHRAIGVDIDPLAVLISRVWTTTVDHDEARSKAREVLARARERFDGISTGDAYPVNSDEETRAFMRYWFDDYARRQLTALARRISFVREETVRNALWCGFSRLIITKQAGACLAMDLSHSRPHKVHTHAPEKPFNKFLAAVERVLSNCLSPKDDHRGPPTRALTGDARNLPVESHSIDLVLTSPPYLNAIDYLRCSKFSLVWMGHSIEALRQLRAQSVGTERGLSVDDDKKSELIVRDLRLRPKLSTRHEAILRRYVGDMSRSVQEVARVLKKGGRAVYVIGENSIKGTYVRNADVVIAVAESAHLQLQERRSRGLPANRRYLPPPERRGDDAALDSRMRREVLLTFERRAA